MTFFSFLGRLLEGSVFEKSGFDKTGIGPQGIGRWPWKNLKKHLPKKQAMEGVLYRPQRVNLWTQRGGANFEY